MSAPLTDDQKGLFLGPHGTLERSLPALYRTVDGEPPVSFSTRPVRRSVYLTGQSP